MTSDNQQGAGREQVPITTLELSHRDTLLRAVRNVLSTDIAHVTFAQLLDGMPLSEVENDAHNDGGYLNVDHPLHTHHLQLCPGAMERAGELYTEFDPTTLWVDAKLLHEYNISAAGSRSFNTSLIELAIILVHQLAVEAYNMPNIHPDDDGMAEWVPPPGKAAVWDDNPDIPPPTLFQHRQYRDYDQYPNGVSDGAAYWAESRIFGGVVLFDRRDPEVIVEAEPEAVYLHPERRDITYRICRLLNDQRIKLLNFLLSEDSQNPSPANSLLPILVNKENWQRVDPEEPIETTGIYRDLWERKDPPLDGNDFRLKDIWDQIDYPTDADWERSWERALARPRIE